jgi:hypothetical protein
MKKNMVSEQVTTLQKAHGFLANYNNNTKKYSFF